MEQQEALCFGRFEVPRRQSQLLVDGKPVELGSRAFDVLLALIDGAGMLVTKSELLDRGWPGQAVEENNVQVQIHALRHALGRDRDLIQTVAGRGYRFVGELRADTPSLEGQERLGAAPPTPGQAVHRRAAVREHQRRPRTGILRGRNG